MTIRAEEEEETKLHVAVRLHNTKLVRAALRDQGLDIDDLGTYGWTALHEAASCGYLDIVVLLLENGADPNIQDSVQRCTPIHLAAKNGHLEVVMSLVRCGARLDLRNAEGKIPQNYADDECREFLQRQRVEDVIKLSPSPVEDGRSVHKLYGHRSSQSPVLKVRQASPQWSESSESSRESMMTSSSSGSSESFLASSGDLQQPGPGEIKVSVSFNRERQTLIVHIGEIRDVKLPADHNLSHIYLKTYIVPDHKKATKRKTPLLTLGRKDGSQSSSSNVTSWDGEEDDHGKRSGKRAGQRLVSSLKRGTRFSLKKKREKDQVICPPENMVGIFRISTAFNETFRYDSADLRKVNFDTSNILLMLCGRNRVTTQSQTIACLSIPFASCAKYGTPQWHPILYRIILPSGQYVEERPSLRTSSSWDQQGGRTQTKRRSLAWNDMSMSMPNIELASSSAPTSQTFPRTSQGGESGFPADGSRRFKKHSGAGKALKKEFQLLKGKRNYRYQNGGFEERMTREETVVCDFGNDLEVSSRSALPPRPSHTGSDLNKTLREQNRDIASKLRDIPKNRMDENRRNTMSDLDSSLHDDAPEVISLDDEEPTSRPELEHRSSFARSLKYSRAFQQKNSAHRRDVVLNDVECEDFEAEIPDAPFAVSNFYGRKSGIACN